MTPEPYVFPSRVSKSGNSFYVRIPREILEALDLVDAEDNPKEVRIRVSVARDE